MIRRRTRRRRLTADWLTDAKRETLLYGMPILDHSPFERFQNEEEKRRAWLDHRKALLAEWDQPGRRPDAYYTYDLRTTPPVQWWRELQVLEQNRLLTRDEEARVERLHVELNPKQAASVHDPNYGAAVLLAGTLGRGFEKQFSTIEFLKREIPHWDFIAGWHARRDRSALADKYRRLAALYAQTLAEMEARQESLIGFDHHVALTVRVAEAIESRRPN